jgi:hypothetical protein
MHPWIDLDAMEDATCLTDEELGLEARIRIPMLVGALALEGERAPQLLTAQIKAFLASDDDEKLGAAARAIMPGLVRALKEAGAAGESSASEAA